VRLTGSRRCLFPIAAVLAPASITEAAKVFRRPVYSEHQFLRDKTPPLLGFQALVFGGFSEQLIRARSTERALRSQKRLARTTKRRHAGSDDVVSWAKTGSDRRMVKPTRLTIAVGSYNVASLCVVLYRRNSPPRPTGDDHHFPRSGICLA
jgi:hypothetical protein